MFGCYSASAQPHTYCNPMNIDYAYGPIPNFSEQGKHRTTADPVITLFKGDYYLFSTNQWGYWWSEDMLRWNFVSRRFLKPWHKVYDDLCAPATLVLGDTLLVVGSTYTLDFPVWMSTKPRMDEWKERVDSFKVGAWDPAFFLDDDGRLYLYFGSSNLYPTYGQEIDRSTFLPIGERVELIHADGETHGWERFGEYNDNTFLNPFVEGSWMNKHGGKYYLQYAGPGTEFSGYGDGVYVGSKPLGPFTYQAHNPFSYKPGGFARGAGHGSTFQDRAGNWWHISTMGISVKNNFERRLGIFPAAFDSDGVLYTNTAYGDYPFAMPGGKVNAPESLFTGWMLLNLNKPVTVSSTLGAYDPNYAVDEDIRTYWSAATGEKGEWIQSDLGRESTVRAIQINYADQDAEFLGKQQGIYHQYKLSSSLDGKAWEVLADKSANRSDIPHEYVELARPARARFVKLENIHVPTGKFAVSGLRVFGNGNGKKPGAVKNFVVLRGQSERRDAWLKWQLMDDAQGYTIYTGIQQDKLYNNIMIYGKNEYYFKGMDKNLPYYFQIEAFNENGVSARTPVIKAE
ncbi:MAG TPA: family 43 glycosylhydrolase [Bacteroidota bacterium]